MFITVDTLRADRLGCYGGPNPTSPAIDRLAAEGTLFVDAYAQRGMTLASMTTFFTSKYPSEHGVLNNTKQISADEWMVAERLAAAGFHARAFNSSGVLDPGRGNQIDQGYKAGTYSMVLDERQMTRQVVEYLQRKFGKDGRREYVWVHFMNPHKPYDPPPPYDKRFDPDYTGTFDGESDTLDRTFVEKTRLEPRDRRHVEALYDGQVALVDDCVAEILAALEAGGLAKDTLVVFSADHGEDLYSHHCYWYHGSSVYRSTLRIPLVFRQPGAVLPGQRLDGIVESVDFAPTVLSWLGLDAGPGPGKDARLRGIDLSPALLEGGSLKKDFAFGQYDEDIFTVRNKEWMLVDNPTRFHPKQPPLEGDYPVEPLELYHVAEDPDEQVNVAERNPEVVARLRRVLQVWRGSLRDGSAAENEDPNMLRELMAQGYLGGAPDAREPAAPPASQPASAPKQSR